MLVSSLGAKLASVMPVHWHVSKSIQQRCSANNLLTVSGADLPALLVCMEAVLIKGLAGEVAH